MSKYKNKGSILDDEHELGWFKYNHNHMDGTKWYRPLPEMLLVSWKGILMRHEYFIEQKQITREEFKVQLKLRQSKVWQALYN